MSGIIDAISKLWDRRERILNGLINCIMIPFTRFRTYFPGFEQARYYLITANQKVGKSKLADYLFVYHSLFYLLENMDKLKLKVIYFTLEMSPYEKYYEFLSHLLFRLDKIRVSTTQLKSTGEEPVSEDILKLLETERYKVYIDKYKEIVEYVSDIKNPTGIFKYCEEYAKEHGKSHFVYRDRKDPLSGEVFKKQVFDRYEKNDEDEYVFVILDNASNLVLEQGMSLMETINLMSKYNIVLRDKYKMSPVLIQHQNQAQEGIENIKLDKMKPSANGLADCKTTIRDVNTAIGLYSPFKFGMREYEGYDITVFQNNIRFMEVIEDRDNGAGGMICPLFFDGAVSSFTELPLPSNKSEIQNVYRYLKQIRPSFNTPNFLTYSTIQHKPINLKGCKLNWLFIYLQNFKEKKRKKNKVING